jgi:hypothetical protein
VKEPKEYKVDSCDRCPMYDGLGEYYACNYPLKFREFEYCDEESDPPIWCPLRVQSIILICEP